MARAVAAQAWIRERPVVLLWVGVAAVALGLRLVALELEPLGGSEARYALEAWRLAQGQPEGSVLQLASPLFSHSLVALFWLFGASDAAARLLSALAGAGAALSPLLLTPPLAPRTGLLAGVLISISPLAVELSRQVEPAGVSFLLVLVASGSTPRWVSDRPGWSPWLLAGSLGLGLAHHPTVVLGVGTAGLAALGASALALGSPVDDAKRVGGALAGAGRPLAFGLVLAVIGATGGLVDLRGVGFLLGDLWAGLGGLGTPPSFSLRNLLSITAYLGPLLALGALGSILAFRRGDRLGTWLGLWAVLLLALAITAREDAPGVLLLPVGPSALLAALLLARLPANRSAYRLGGAGWAAVSGTIAAAGVVLIVGAHTVAAARPLGGGALLAVAGLVVGLSTAWGYCLRQGQHVPALVVLGGGVYVLATISSLGRLSFGGSPPGTEPLRLEQTAPSFRTTMQGLALQTGAEGTPSLVVELDSPEVARWYARALSPGGESAPSAPGAIVVRPAPEGADLPEARAGIRGAWRTRSTVNPVDWHPLGLARWEISRSGLVVGRTDDAIIVRLR